MVSSVWKVHWYSLRSDLSWLDSVLRLLRLMVLFTRLRSSCSTTDLSNKVTQLYFLGSTWVYSVELCHIFLEFLLVLDCLLQSLLLLSFLSILQRLLNLHILRFKWTSVISVWTLILFSSWKIITRIEWICPSLSAYTSLECPRLSSIDLLYIISLSEVRPFFIVKISKSLAANSSAWNVCYLQSIKEAARSPGW